MTDSEIVPGHYIVTFKPHVTMDLAHQHIDSIHAAFTQRAAQFGITHLAGVIHRYNILKFTGYSGGFDDETLNSIRASGEVESVEPDTLVQEEAGEIHTEDNVPSWGLARICRDHAVKDMKTYVYSDPNGDKTQAYVIDSGIYIEHNEFNDGDKRRAIWGKTIVSSAKNTSDTDTSGHGTHVAGTIAGYTCGVAKKAKVIAVKVFRDATEDEKKNHVKVGARTSDVIKGLEWSVGDAGTNIHKSVVNMSLGGSYSAAQNLAVRNTVYAGMTVVVSSGNQTVDASTRSPASAPEAICVGATKEDDTTRKTSNFGKCVDVLAPGDKITSAGIASRDELVVKSGTSMASPHVAGVVCCLLSSDPSDTQPVTPIQLVKKMAGRDEIAMKAQKDTLNLMLNNGMHVA